jgi:predicted PurR-regulated permease PerM
MTEQHPGVPDTVQRGPAWTQTRAALRVVLVVVAVALVLWLIARLRAILLLLVLSVFFAYFISPLVEFVKRPVTLRGRPRSLSQGVAIFVVYLLLIGSVTIAVAWLVPRFNQQVTQMASQTPAYVATLQERARTVTDRLDKLGLPPDARQAAQDAIGAGVSGVEDAGRRFLLTLVGLLSYLPWLVLIPILAYFLLKDAESFRESAICLLPEGRLRAQGAQLFNRINAAMAAYIRAQLLACLIVGGAVTLGFALLRMPYALVLGAFAGLAEFIPLVGPVLVAVISTVLAALYSPLLALWVMAYLAVIRILEDYVIYPRLVGTVIDMHPLAVILAVLAGAELAGVAGIFLSVPVVAILSAAYRQYLASRRSRPEPGGATQPE